MVDAKIIIATPTNNGVDYKKNLEESLNSFLADEYTTASQYFLSGIVAKGKGINFLTQLFQDSYADELVHMKKISDFMQSVGMNVQVSLNELIENSTFPFHHINSEESTVSLCKLMIESENAAIDSYSAFMRCVETSDFPDLNILIGEILTEEREHKKELEDLLSSIGEENCSTLPEEIITTSMEKPDIVVEPQLPSSIHKLFKAAFFH